MKIIKSAAVVALIAAGILSGCSDNAGKKVINGAGASFPAPVYQAWTHAYSMSTPSVRVNYQSIGSGAGVNQIRSGTIDFAGTDSPLTEKELSEAGLSQFPMLTGGVVVIFNIPGVKDGALRLSRDVLAGIFLGEITKWNDPRITAVNKDLILPDLDITVVRRADASGTTFIFTDYLSKISGSWKSKAGCGASVNWPVGIGGQKNPGVCNSVAKISGAIGYTEYTYASEARLAMASLENRSGRFVSPSVETFSAGAEKADWENAPAFSLMLTDVDGENTWPIVGVTYILVRNDATPENRDALVKYFKWCFADGSAAARRLSYVPLPENAVKLVMRKILDK